MLKNNLRLRRGFMALETARVKRYYDRFGSKQDSQGFYEDLPIERMIEHADFESANNVFELGCGTGRLAQRLLASHLPANASYRGTDVSDTMIALATDRLVSFGSRASVELSAGGSQVPLKDQSVDRFLSVYVLDLLPDDGIAQVFSEAHRVLITGGKLCCISLGHGANLGAKIVGGLWSMAYRIAPMLVGGCRPISFESYMEAEHWAVLYRDAVSPFGIPSEVLVANPIR
jgi:ubiquinone/menaquinone biosynthesis C-methylase UbiE